MPFPQKYVKSCTSCAHIYIGRCADMNEHAVKFTHLYWLSSAVIASDGNKTQNNQFLAENIFTCFAYKFLHAIDSKKTNVSIWWLSPSALFNKSNIVISTINIYIENNNNPKKNQKKQLAYEKTKEIDLVTKKRNV